MMKQLTSLQHPLVKHLAKLRQNSAYRYDHQRIVLEGAKIISEVCQKTTPINLLVVDPEAIPRGIKPLDSFVVTEEIIYKIAGSRSPEGIIAEIPMPQFQSLEGCGSILALDGVSDPGNLGALLRSAVAFGWEGVFLLDGCCDPFNDKCLRAARGATFKVPMASGSWEELDQVIALGKMQPFVADLKGTALPKMGAVEAPVLILGNEARGVSTHAKKRAKAVTIPMDGAIESLNVAVAGGIIMYAMGMLRRRS